MNIQDKLERILRDMHILLSRAPESDINDEYVLIPKKEMQKQLGNISQAVREMMDAYEITQQSRNRGELEAEKHRIEIVRNANHQAQDIYAASVIYSEDALGRIQDIIETAEKSSKKILKNVMRELEEEKRVIRSNQLELITQLEDMNDTAKYMKLIEERNRELAKEKAKKQEKQENRGKDRTRRQQGGREETEREPEENASLDEAVVYEKPVIKINPEYFKKLDGMVEETDFDLENESDGAQKAGEEKEEKHQRFFSFGRKS